LNDISKLYPERTVAGLKLKPWTLGQLVEASPALDAIFVAAEALGIDLGAQIALAMGIAQTAAVELTPTQTSRLVVRSLPHLLPILAASTGRPIDELRELSLPATVQLTMAVLGLNAEQLVSFTDAGAAGGGTAQASPTTSTSS
jgi:hypothetical protein